jgi:hypothetical protein
MKHFGLVLQLALFAALVGCHAESRLPTEESNVEIEIPSVQLICKVRQIARENDLSFHYGTSEQPYGTLSTFRLIGRGFEITLYNPEKPNSYILSLYENPPGKEPGLGKAAYRNVELALETRMQGCKG